MIKEAHLWPTLIQALKQPQEPGSGAAQAGLRQPLMCTEYVSVYVSVCGCCYMFARVFLIKMLVCAYCECMCVYVCVRTFEYMI